MAVDQNLAQISNLLVYSAMVVYAGALGAYATDLSGRGRTPAERQAAGAPRELVGAGATGTTAAAGGTVADRAAPAEDADAAGTPGWGSPEGLAALSDRAATDGGPGDRGTGRRRFAGIGVALTWLACALHLGAVATRGISADRVPWGNMYEFTLTGSFVVTAVFLAILLRRDLRFLGTFVIGPVLLTLGLAIAVLYTQSAQLVPALQSVWLVIHVSIAFIASALLTMGFSATVLQLVQERRERGRALGRPPVRGRFMDDLPASAELERTAYRLHAIAFPLWTFTVIAGAIWAERAWGRYWGWDPKEVWSFVIWVVYAGYLHARATRGWDGRRSAYLAIAGFGCLLFNFLVVNIFFAGLHSYAGVG